MGTGEKRENPTSIRFRRYAQEKGLDWVKRPGNGLFGKSFRKIAFSFSGLSYKIIRELRKRSPDNYQLLINAVKFFSFEVIFKKQDCVS